MGRASGLPSLTLSVHTIGWEFAKEINGRRHSRLDNQAGKTLQSKGMYDGGPSDNDKEPLWLGLRGQKCLRHNLCRVFGWHQKPSYPLALRILFTQITVTMHPRLTMKNRFALRLSHAWPRPQSQYKTSRSPLDLPIFTGSLSKAG